MIKVLVNMKTDENSRRKLKEIEGYEFIFTKNQEDAYKYIEDCEVFITFSLNKKHLELAQNLKWIAVMFAGVESLPLNLIKEKNIILTNGRGIAGAHMAEYVIAAMIMLARNYKTVENNTKNKVWDNNLEQDEIFGKTVGILGLGSIGGTIAKYSSLLGMKVIGYKRHLEPVAYVDEVYTDEKMGEIFKKSDFVVNVLPYTKDTHEIIDYKYFSLMNSESYYINIGRGKTTKEEDLIKALKEHKIKGADLDVFREEPLPKDNPLWDMENVIVTPHLSGISKTYNEKAVNKLIPNLLAYRDHKEMSNLINLNMGY